MNMYDNHLLVFTLSGNVAHSFLIKSLGEIIECVQKILIVKRKCALRCFKYYIKLAKGTLVKQYN